MEKTIDLKCKKKKHGVSYLDTQLFWLFITLFASHYRPWIHRWVCRTRRSVAVLITTPTTPLSYLEQRDEVSLRNWYTRWTSVHRGSAAFNIPTRERRIKSRGSYQPCRSSLNDEIYGKSVSNFLGRKFLLLLVFPAIRRVGSIVDY